MKIVLLGNRVVFVIVANGTAHGEAHEGGADGIDAVDDVFEMAFLGECCSNIDDQMQSIEAGGDQLLLGGVFVEIAGDLVFRELVVR